jgi:hypothetical protein
MTTQSISYEHTSSQYAEQGQGNRSLPRHGFIIARGRRSLLKCLRHGSADVRLVAVSYDDIWEDANAISEVVADCDCGREIEIGVCSVVMGEDLASNAGVGIGERRRDRGAMREGG